MNFKRRDCISHMPKRSAGMNERVDNSCKQRAKYLHHSLVILHTECGQWQTSFIQEKSVYPAEVSIMEPILQKFPNS